MASFPGRITYRWVARDNLILAGKDEFEKEYVTPYKIPRSRAREHEVGAHVPFDLPGDSHQLAYLRYFIPEGFSWQDVPPGYEDAPTLGALCQRLTSDKPLVYPVECYGEPQKALWGGAMSLLQMMLNVWGNTDFRWALVSGGWKPFSWAMLGANGKPLLQCPLSLTGVGENARQVRLAKVLARDPEIRKIDVTGTPHPEPREPTAPGPKVTTVGPKRTLSEDERIRAALQAAIPALRDAGIPVSVLSWVTHKPTGVSFRIFPKGEKDGARFDVDLIGAGTMRLRESVLTDLIPRSSATVAQVLHESAHAYMTNVLKVGASSWYQSGIAHYKTEMRKVSILVTDGQAEFMFNEAVGNYVARRVQAYAGAMSVLRRLAAEGGGAASWSQADKVSFGKRIKTAGDEYDELTSRSLYEGYNESVTELNGPPGEGTTYSIRLSAGIKAVIDRDILDSKIADRFEDNHDFDEFRDMTR